MKIQCIECKAIHEINGWITLKSPPTSNERCEVHITCSCNNKMTVEHQHHRRVPAKKEKNITLTLGCKIINEDQPHTVIVPDYHHNFSDVLTHYFNEPTYDEWNTPSYVENYI